MKIAISASYFDVKAVRDVLCSCDMVFTTNVDARDRIYEALGSHRVRFIPFSTEAMGQFLAQQYGPDCTVVSFGDLRKVVRAQIDDGDVETMRLMADYFGWSWVPQVLYDEEGIDGELWSNKEGKEFTCFAGEVPDGVQADMSHKM